MLAALGAECRLVRVPADLDGLDGLVMPGGESTTMSLGIAREGLAEPLRELAAAGTPVLGTCAGMIMLDRDHLGVMDTRAERNAFGRQVRSFEADLDLPGVDGPPMRAVFIRARRNAFGRQVRSFEADLDFDGLDGGPLRAVFIRAPWIEEHGGDVTILAELDGHPVAARQGAMLAVAFHPELAGDPRVHQQLLTLIRDRA